MRYKKALRAKEPRPSSSTDSSYFLKCLQERSEEKEH